MFLKILIKDFVNMVICQEQQLSRIRIGSKIKRHLINKQPSLEFPYTRGSFKDKKFLMRQASSKRDCLSVRLSVRMSHFFTYL